MIKPTLWFVLHLAGLLMLIVIWGTDDAPVLFFPGLFGLVGGASYGVGTVRLLLWAREGHS